MEFTRRDFGKLAIASIPAVTLGESRLFGAAPAIQTRRPNSTINGVRIGSISYSYRQMPDQSPEAVLRYLVDSGISHVEMEGNRIEPFANPPAAPARGGGAGAGTARAGGAGRGAADPATLTASWNGVPCAPMGPGGVAIPAPGAAAAAPAAGAGGGGGRGAGAAQTPEQQAAQQAYQKSLLDWRTSVKMDRFEALRKMYNDAGVSIYATKMINANMSDAELDYCFRVAKALGADHTTLELVTDAAALKRLGTFGEKHGIYVAYHTHLQGNMTAFDTAFAASRFNRANVDFGHYVAAGSGNPVTFLEKFHDKTASFHLKDRTTPRNCSLNLAWGTGETPIKEVLQAMRKNGWRNVATIELEYAIPEGSDSVKEVAKCLQYCRQALA